ncbi:hypothetical protein CROQUDRAFT_96717 [Cronartium quercuum f. sp. fusiforme G11]|uniref:Uncharacterized protein n=1 Tax=Cronartium quercuum f. sp. fusiforme G11 TaxID=708437 RepID=A0A9P6T8I0_9BASI|nr:hypothetical protein CROQUDRAFT_96717 [Cronartium quercuum f. sp. fusiforme G11]
MLSISIPLLFILWSQLKPTDQLQLPKTLVSDPEIRPSQIEQAVQSSSCVGYADSMGPKTDKHPESRNLQDEFESLSKFDGEYSFCGQHGLGCIPEGFMKSPMNHNVPVIQSHEEGFSDDLSMAEALHRKKPGSSGFGQQQQFKNNIQTASGLPLPLDSYWNPGKVEEFGPQVERFNGWEVLRDTLPETLNEQSDHYQERMWFANKGLSWPSVPDHSHNIMNPVTPAHLYSVSQPSEYSPRKRIRLDTRPEPENFDYITQVQPAKYFSRPNSSLMLPASLPKQTEGIYPPEYTQGTKTEDHIVDLKYISTNDGNQKMDHVNQDHFQRLSSIFHPSLSDLTPWKAVGSGNSLSSGSYHIENNLHPFDPSPICSSVNQENIHEMNSVDGQIKEGKRKNLQDSEEYQERFHNPQKPAVENCRPWKDKKVNVQRRSGCKKIIKWFGLDGPLSSDLLTTKISQWFDEFERRIFKLKAINLVKFEKKEAVIIQAIHRAYSDLTACFLGIIAIVHQDRFLQGSHEHNSLIGDGWEYLQEVLEQWVTGDLIELPEAPTRQRVYFDGTQPLNLFHQLSKPPNEHTPLPEDTLWKLWKKWYRTSSNPSKRFFAFQAHFFQEIEKTLITLDLMDIPVGRWRYNIHNWETPPSLPSDRLPLLIHYLGINSRQVKNRPDPEKKFSASLRNRKTMADAQTVGRFEIQLLGLHIPVEEWFDNFHDDLKAQARLNHENSMSITFQEIWNLVKLTYSRLVAGFFGMIRLLHLNHPINDPKTLDPLIESGWNFLTKILVHWRNPRPSHPLFSDYDVNADEILPNLSHEAHGLYQKLFQQPDTYIIPPDCFWKLWELWYTQCTLPNRRQGISSCEKFLNEASQSYSTLMGEQSTQIQG